MKITRVQLHCRDPERQCQFYSQTLGMPVADGIIRVGWTELHFLPGKEHRYHLALNWPSNQWEEGISWLSARTQLVADSQGQTRFEFESWRARSVYFWDPAGNLVEAIVRDRLEEKRSAPEWLCVSEVGLVVEDVTQTKEQLGLPVFGPCREDFCALGDDQGLLIVARRNRIWYPTSDLAATIAPLRLEWDGGRYEHE